MRIEIRSDCVILDGYVNVTGRDSKPIVTMIGRCVEQIEPRAFDRALGRAANVDLLLNHDPVRKLGSTSDKTLELYEDNIGLRAVSTVYDPEVIQKAQEKKLRGWSFGMYVNKERKEERADTIPRRLVEDLDIFEVSIIDDRKSPCYTGTSIEQRAEGETVAETRSDEFRAIIVDNAKLPDYTEFDNKITKYKEKKK